MDEHDTVVPSSRRVVGLLLPGELSFSTPGRGGTGPPSLVFFYGHHGDDNSGRVSGLHVVRGRQSPPIWTRTVTGEAGENGQSSGAVSDRRARIRPSVTSGEIGTFYRIG